MLGSVGGTGSRTNFARYFFLHAEHFVAREARDYHGIGLLGVLDDSLTARSEVLARGAHHWVLHLSSRALKHVKVLAQLGFEAFQDLQGELDKLLLAVSSALKEPRHGQVRPRLNRRALYGDGGVVAVLLADELPHARGEDLAVVAHAHLIALLGERAGALARHWLLQVDGPRVKLRKKIVVELLALEAGLVGRVDVHVPHRRVGRPDEAPDDSGADTAQVVHIKAASRLLAFCAGVDPRRLELRVPFALGEVTLRLAAD